MHIICSIFHSIHFEGKGLSRRDESSFEKKIFPYHHQRLWRTFENSVFEAVENSSKFVVGNMKSHSFSFGILWFTTLNATTILNLI